VISLPRKSVSLSLSLSLPLSVRDACAVMPVRVVGCHCFSNYPVGAEHRALERSSITSSLVTIPAWSPGYVLGAVRARSVIFFPPDYKLRSSSLILSINPPILISFKRYLPNLIAYLIVSFSNFNIISTVSLFSLGGTNLWFDLNVCFIDLIFFRSCLYEIWKINI